MSQNITLGNDLITVHYYKGLPDKFFGCVCKKSDHEYLILINADHEQHVQDEALKHELWHIKNKDFDNPDMESVELLAHSLDINNYDV